MFLYISEMLVNPKANTIQLKDIQFEKRKPKKLYFPIVSDQVSDFHTVTFKGTLVNDSLAVSRSWPHSGIAEEETAVGRT